MHQADLRLSVREILGPPFIEAEPVAPTPPTDNLQDLPLQTLPAALKVGRHREMHQLRRVDPLPNLALPCNKEDLGRRHMRHPDQKF
jgi:hypothetical protein